MRTISLSSSLRSLKESGVIPSNIEHSMVGDFHMVNYWNSLNSQIISESVQCGMSRDLNTAIAKCTSEYVERLATTKNWDRHSKVTSIVRTDGYACFPRDVYFESQSLKRARENALYEATERYVWASWWDNQSIGFNRNKVNFSELGFRQTEELLNSFLNIKCIHLVKPLLLNTEYEVVILLLELGHGGYITGGACGPRGSKNQIERALVELVRHCLAYKKLLQNGLKPDSFYSERLCFFASGRGKELVKGRLESSGIESISLPSLAVDELIPHALSDFFHVYRCLYENQPVFVGGPLERLCL